MTDDVKKTELQKPEADQKPPSSDVRPPSAMPTKARHSDPTRYGDWEIGGKCVDF